MKFAARFRLLPALGVLLALPAIAAPGADPLRWTNSIVAVPDGPYRIQN
jgi:hypothetical protein